jgi:hypothetical protein
MQEITRKFKVNEYRPKTYRILTTEEALEEGIDLLDSYVDARPGDWISTVDGWACEVVRFTRHNNKAGFTLVDYTFPHCHCMYREIVSEAGEVTQYSVQKLKYEPWSESERASKRIQFGSSSPKDWVEDALRRSRVKQAIRIAANMIVRKRRPLSERDYEFIGRMFRPDKRIPQANAIILFKQPRVKRALAMEIAKLVTDMGVDPNNVIEMYLDALAMARDKEQPNAMIAVADRFSSLLGMDKPETKATDDDGGYMLEGDWKEVTEELEAHDEQD